MNEENEICIDADEGNVDAFGSGCADYKREWCNVLNYNTATFIANTMCCICNGGIWQQRGT